MDAHSGHATLWVVLVLALALVSSPAVVLEQEPVTASLAGLGRISLGFAAERVELRGRAVRLSANPDVQALLETAKGDRALRVALGAAEGEGTLTRTVELFDGAGAPVAKGAMTLDLDASDGAVSVRSLRIDQLEGAIGRLARPAVFATPGAPLAWRTARRLTGRLERAPDGFEGEIVLSAPLTPDAFLGERGAPIGVSLDGVTVSGVATVSREAGAIVWQLDERVHLTWREEGGAWRGQLAVTVLGAAKRVLVRLGDGHAALSLQASLPVAERDRS